MKRICAVFVMILLCALAFSEPRNALLIANGNYKAFGSLATPVKEARDLKATLEKLNFKVTILENGTLEKMLDAVNDFGNLLNKQGGIGFFHYGGHAVQVNGANYLIPVDADIPDERRVRVRTMNVDEVMLNMVADTNIVVLDACRNNPLPSSSGRSATRGLVLANERPKNSIIIYSAQAGKVAQDGVFTPILTKKLLEQKELGTVLRDVRREVNQKTQGVQSPGEYNELMDSVYLAGFAQQSPVQTQPVTPLPAPVAKENTSKDEKNVQTVSYVAPQAQITHETSNPKASATWEWNKIPKRSKIQYDEYKYFSKTFEIAPVDGSVGAKFELIKGETKFKKENGIMALYHMGTNTLTLENIEDKKKVEYALTLDSPGNVELTICGNNGSNMGRAFVVKKENTNLLEVPADQLINGFDHSKTYTLNSLDAGKYRLLGGGFRIIKIKVFN